MGEAQRRFEAGLMPNQQKIGQLKVDLKDATPKLCECGCQYFLPVIKAYIISALISPLGKESLAQQPVLICMECKKELKIS